MGIGTRGGGERPAACLVVLTPALGQNEAAVPGDFLVRLSGNARALCMEE